MSTFLTPIELGTVYANEVNNYATCDCEAQKPVVIVLNGNPYEEQTNYIIDNQTSQNILGDTINEIKGLVGELKNLIVKEDKVKKSTNPFAEDNDAVIKAKKDRQIEKLCKKLDEAGIDQDKVDEIQEKLTSEEFEDLAPSKQKKVAKAIKELTNLVNKERLLPSDRDKIENLTNKILDLVKEVKTDKTNEKPKAEKPVEEIIYEEIVIEEVIVAETPAEEKKEEENLDITNAKNMASDVADMNDTIAEIKRNQVLERGERTWDKYEKILESGNDSNKVETLKKIKNNMSKEEFTVFVLNHLDEIVESAFNGINDTDTLAFIYQTLDKDINKQFILPTPQNDDERANNYKIKIKEIAKDILGTDYEKYTENK